MPNNVLHTQCTPGPIDRNKINTTKGHGNFRFDLQEKKKWFTKTHNVHEDTLSEIKSFNTNKITLIPHQLLFLISSTSLNIYHTLFTLISSWVQSFFDQTRYFRRSFYCFSVYSTFGLQLKKNIIKVYNYIINLICIAIFECFDMTQLHI